MEVTTPTKGEASLDRWTLVHLASGFALGWLGAGLLTTATVLVGYEAFEMQLRKVPATGDSNGFVAGLLEFESQKNILADLIAGLAGYFVGLAFRQ